MTAASALPAKRDLPTWRFVAALACYSVGCWQSIYPQSGVGLHLWPGAFFLLGLSWSQARQPVTRRQMAGITASLAAMLALIVLVAFLLPTETPHWLSVRVDKMASYVMPTLLIAAWPFVFFALKQRWQRRRTDDQATDGWMT